MGWSARPSSSLCLADAALPPLVRLVSFGRGGRLQGRPGCCWHRCSGLSQTSVCDPIYAQRNWQRWLREGETCARPSILRGTKPIRVLLWPAEVDRRRMWSFPGGYCLWPGGLMLPREKYYCRFLASARDHRGLGPIPFVRVRNASCVVADDCSLSVDFGSR